MRQMVAYHTQTGSILRNRNKDVDPVVVLSGTCSVEGDKVTASGFSGVAQVDDFCDLISGDGFLRRKVTQVVSDTELHVERPYVVSGSLQFRILRHTPASQYTADEKTAFLAEVKAEVGHENVAVLGVEASAYLSETSHYVDLSDSNKIKRKEATIVYE